ncbi:MAG: hypothetical protein R3174_11490 [Gammaproteobacteria bacterium]|nr:hypothetical protein [Gammaproteobacteria bacterium]
MDNQKLVLLVVALVIAVTALAAHLFIESRQGVPGEYSTAVEPAPDQSAGDALRPPADAGVTMRKTPPAPAEAVPGPGGDLAAVISLLEEGFEPVTFDIRASSFPLNLSLTRTRPGSVREEPRYAGDEIWYGVLELGGPPRDFPFALDLTPEGRFRMYFDANSNGDLTDDAGPLENQGSGDGGPGGFATRLRVPWPLLSPQSGFQGEFEIWFFSNKSGWEKGNRASHYSRTQLRGEVTLHGRRYRAWIADSGYNDADLTNDGVLLDLNGNGKADRDEWFADLNMEEKFVRASRGKVQVRW